MLSHQRIVLTIGLLLLVLPTVMITVAAVPAEYAAALKAHALKRWLIACKHCTDCCASKPYITASVEELWMRGELTTALQDCCSSTA
jgi:hypothetical protein